MRKHMISYDEYYELCDAVNALMPGTRYVPGPEEAENISSPEMIGLFASYAIWVIETAGDPQNEEEAKALTILNRNLIRNVTFFDNDELESEVEIQEGILPAAVVTVNESCFPEGERPSLEDIEAMPDSFYRHGFGFCMLLSAKNKGDNNLARALAKRTEETCIFVPDDNIVRMNRRKWETFFDESVNANAYRDHWWPDDEDVERYVVPNFPKCLDFVLWLLYAGEPATNPDDVEVEKKLKNLVETKTFIA